MAYPKIITKTKISSAVRRKARRAARSWNTNIIVFRNQNDENGDVHFRTLGAYDTPTCGNMPKYWNFVGYSSQSFKLTDGWFPAVKRIHGPIRAVKDI